MRNLIISLLLSLTLTACSGSDGSNGRNGATGANGSNGNDGIGANGTDGTDGGNGTTSDTHIVNPLGIFGTVSTTPATANIDANNASFSALTAKAKTDGALNVTLQGFAVIHSNKTNQTQLSRIISPRFNQSYMPAVTLRFDENGAMSGVTAYADKEYNTISVDNTLFGFTANYMVTVEWADTDMNGMMLAGFDAQRFPTISTDIEFTGMGKGKYRDSKQTNYDTTFTAKADVNFSNKTVAFSATDTKNADNTDRAELDFTAPIVNFADNHISTDIIAGSLAGKLDARFYGNNAWEFGGTFALADANNSYYGVFGADRDGIDLSNSRAFHENIDEAIPATRPDGFIVPNIDTDAGETEAYPSINDAYYKGISGTSSIINMNALAVFGDIRTDYARTNAIASLNDGDRTPSNNITRLSNAAASITFNDFANISAVSLYLDNSKPYTTTAHGSNNSVQNIDIDGAPDDADSATLNLRWLNADTTIFGYESTNFAYIDWAISKVGTDDDNLIDATYDIAGMMVAGVESKANQLINAGKTVFTGGGLGYHTDKDGNRTNRYFNLSANIDFNNYNITLASTDTCDFELHSGNSRKCNMADSQNYQLNFIADLNYEANSNIISGDVKTTDTDTSYKGIADARFYGADGDELAGSFAMSNADNYQYYGVFGSELGDNYTIIETARGTDTTINGASVPPPTDPAFELTGFNDTSRNSTSNYTMKIASIVQITKNATDNSITNEKISGGIVRFSYESDGDFAGAGFILYVADKKYESISTGSSPNSIDASVPTINGVPADQNNIGNRLFLDKDMTRFGFVPNYMARLFWQAIPTNVSDKSYGFGMVGFETLGTDIPTASGATFKGEGQGQYHDKNSFATQYVNSDTHFAITANVDFGDRTVDLTSSETCSLADCAGGTNIKYDHLNFTGTLSYERDGTHTPINSVTGTIKTAGADKDFRTDDGTELHGTANAKFYGTGTDAATEFGGTFSLTNNEAGYVGYFGAEKQ